MDTAGETPVVDGRACIKKIPRNRHAAENARLLTTKEDHPPRSLRVPFKHIDAPLSRILPGLLNKGVLTERKPVAKKPRARRARRHRCWRRKEGCKTRERLTELIFWFVYADGLMRSKRIGGGPLADT